MMAIDLGTFCDNNLMDMALSRVGRCKKVIFMSDAKHKLPPSFVHYPFETPPEWINNINMPMADTVPCKVK